MKTLWPGIGGPVINYISKPPKNLPKLRKIAVLGSTGSIGRNVLNIARQKKNALQVIALAGGRNMREMRGQAEEFRPAQIAMQSGEIAEELAGGLSYSPAITWEQKAYAEIAAIPEADMVVSAQSGGAGLSATLAAVLAGKIVCLANKESLVLAGPLVREICAKTGAAILPVDSEHNAIFQCLAGREQNISKIIITASGGPFRGRKKSDLLNIDPKEALAHPNWKMGPKITIDSSTMMNKTLELIEAVQLFGIKPDKLEVLVQPQSLVHSMVELADGSILAQLGTPDMRLPIAFCLLWPNAEEHDVGRLDLAKAGKLEFSRPDEEAFPALSIGRKALMASPESGLAPACVILNAANEICVELFLDGRISWQEITIYVEKALDELGGASLPATGLPASIPTAPAKIAELAIEMGRPIMELDHQVRNFVLKSVAENNFEKE